MSQQIGAPEAPPEAPTAGVVASAADETPVYLPVGEEFVFGILTRPVVNPNGTAVLCVHAGVQNLSSHRNALYTGLCRELAGLGYLTFRMDFHGSGDSSGLLADRDVAGQTSDDVDAAVAWLLDQGAETVAIAGTCWGGLVALVAAARLDAICSVCLISPPLRGIDKGVSVRKLRRKHGRIASTAAQFFQPRVVKLLLTKREYRSWVMARALHRLRRALPGGRARIFAAAPPPPADVEPASTRIFGPLRRRNVPIRALFAEDERTYVDLMTPGTLPALEEAGDIMEISVTPISVHGLSTLQAQEIVRAHIHRSLARDRPTTPGQADHG